VDPAGTQSDASAETIDYRPPPDRHRFFLRLSVGAGMGLISDESQLIDYSQYGQLFRMWGFIDFGWIPLPHVGIGAWEAATGRATGNALFPNGAPHFYELDTMTGTSLFAFDELKTSRDPITIYAAFRTGVAFGHAGIGTLERIGTAPAWGAEVGVRVRWIGLSLGVISAIVQVPTELGQRYDLGGAYFLLNGYVGE